MARKWRIVRLGDLLVEAPQRGLNLAKNGLPGAIPFIETSHISAGTAVLRDAPATFTLDDHKGRLTRNGDLLLTARGLGPDRQTACGRVQFDEPAAFAESLVLLRPNPELVEPDYLRIFLTSRQGRSAIMRAVSGSVITNLRPRLLADVEIRTPTKDIQHAITKSLRTVETALEEIERMEVKVAALYDTLREGLISQRISPVTAELIETKRKVRVSRRRPSDQPSHSAHASEDDARGLNETIKGGHAVEDGS
jgi:restriction endonuclease S subunit